MSIFTDVAVRRSLQDYCDSRDKVVKMVRECHRISELANAEMANFCRYGRGARMEFGIDRELRDIDEAYWRYAFEKTGLIQMMDAETHRKFEQSFRDKVPEFTIENIEGTFIEMFQKSEEMFNAGLVNVFKRLGKDYATNDSFKVGEKIIMSYMVQPNYKRGMSIRYGYPSDQINDLDRVFSTLDGKKHIPRSLQSAMDAAFVEGNIYDGSMFYAKCFKNGNLHLTFKRTDLLEKANLIIAKHYGGNSISQGKR